MCPLMCFLYFGILAITWLIRRRSLRTGTCTLSLYTCFNVWRRALNITCGGYKCSGNHHLMCRLYSLIVSRWVHCSKFYFTSKVLVSSVTALILKHFKEYPASGKAFASKIQTHTHTHTHTHTRAQSWLLEKYVGPVFHHLSKGAT